MRRFPLVVALELVQRLQETYPPTDVSIVTLRYTLWPARTIDVRCERAQNARYTLNSSRQSSAERGACNRCGCQYSVEAPVRVRRAAAPTVSVVATRPAVPKSHHGTGDASAERLAFCSRSDVQEAEER